MLRLLDRRLTLGLFAAFFVLFALSRALPQQGLDGPQEVRRFQAAQPALWRAVVACGADDVYASGPARLIYALFGLQVLAFVVVRARATVAEACAPAVLPPSALTVSVHRRAQGDALQRLRDALSARGYWMTRGVESRVYAVKNRFSKLGTLVLHAAFLPVLVGGAFMANTRFRGEVVLAEGQPFTGTAAEYLGWRPGSSPPRAPLPRLCFSPERVLVAYDGEGLLTDLTCTLRLPGPPPAQARIAVNVPYLVDDVAVLLLRVGVAPEVQVRQGDHVVDQVIPNLEVWGRGSPEDDFRLARPPGVVRMRFFPAYEEVDGSPVSRTLEPRSPRFLVSVALDDPAVPPAQGLLRPGEALRVGTYDLQLLGFRRWAAFLVSRDAGGGLLVLGLLGLVVGAALRFAFPRRWVAGETSASADGMLLLLRGRQEFLPAAALEDELRALLDAAIGPSAPSQSQ